MANRLLHWSDIQVITFQTNPYMGLFSLRGPPKMVVILFVSLIGSLNMASTLLTCIPSPVHVIEPSASRQHGPSQAPYAPYISPLIITQQKGTHLDERRTYRCWMLRPPANYIAGTAILHSFPELRPPQSESLEKLRGTWLNLWPPD